MNTRIRAGRTGPARERMCGLGLSDYGFWVFESGLLLSSWDFSSLELSCNDGDGTNSRGTPTEIGLLPELPPKMVDVGDGSGAVGWFTFLLGFCSNRMDEGESAIGLAPMGRTG